MQWSSTESNKYAIHQLLIQFHCVQCQQGLSHSKAGGMGVTTSTDNYYFIAFLSSCPHLLLTADGWGNCSGNCHCLCGSHLLFLTKISGTPYIGKGPAQNQNDTPTYYVHCSFCSSELNANRDGYIHYGNVARELRYHSHWQVQLYL